jgi:hypothetical protein
MLISVFIIIMASFIVLFIDSTTVAASNFIVTNGSDFNVPLTYSDEYLVFPAALPKGYQTAAEVTAVFFDSHGAKVAIPDGSVAWTIESVQNKAKAWNRDPGDKSGLAWGDAEVDGTVAWASDTLIGTPTTNATVQLTDVVGERIVTLKAAAIIGGVPYSGTTAVTFGKGPLSVFMKPPIDGKKWAKSSGIPDTAVKHGDFTALTKAFDFPAAEVCGGTVHTGPSDIDLGGSGPYSYTADFSSGIRSGHWRVGDGRRSEEYYSITSKLPTLGQLIAVSAFRNRFYSKIKRKGAALAAGWPDDATNGKLYIYWTGQVIFFSRGYFLADLVFLSSGYAFGNDFVTYADPVVACVQSGS